MPSENKRQSLNALASGTVLRDYIIESELGSGGFSIVYLARHHLKADWLYAIKEFLPGELAVRGRNGTHIHPVSTEAQSAFDDGLQRFRGEAEQLRKFRNERYIVSCQNYFEENGTAYLVMDYDDGLPLSEFLLRREAAGQPFTEADLLAVVEPLLEGLAVVHRADVLHRDIKPGNIFVRRRNDLVGRPAHPVLIDFGAAKQNYLSRHSRSHAPYTPGYAAYEQVSSMGGIGPWTDIYAVGALMWRMVAGGCPPDDSRLLVPDESTGTPVWSPTPRAAEKRSYAVHRGQPDPMVPAVELGAGQFSRHLLEAIDGCLALYPEDRVQSCEELRKLLKVSAASADASPAQTSAQHDETHKGEVKLVFWATTFRAFRAFLNEVKPVFWATTFRAFRALWEEFRAFLNEVKLVFSATTFRVFRTLWGEFRAFCSEFWSDFKLLFLVTIFIVFGLVLFIFLTHEDRLLATPEERETNADAISAPALPFTVRTEPANSEIVLINHDELYEPGITLAEGWYHVEVSFPGYQSKRVWLAHRNGIITRTISLEPIEQAFTVEVDPPGARIRILNIQPLYEHGMMLSAGDYRVEVSATGYETMVETVSHGTTQPTVHRVTLQPSLPYSLVPANGVATGMLEQGDLEFDSGAYYDIWLVQIESGKTLSVDLVSSDFDVYMVLRNFSDEQYIAHDDDSGGGTNASMSVRLAESGEFMIIATSYSAGEVGEYQLSVDIFSPADQADEIVRQSENSFQSSTFTRGSHQDDVIRIQGTPTEIISYQYLGYEHWKYGRSTVTISISSRRVTEWDNYDGNLKIRMFPDRNTTDSATFTRGSHQDDVIRIQGTPTEIISYQYLGYEHWKYGRSTVTISISSRRVTEWDNYDGNLKIRMFPDRNTTDSATFTRGSHQDDVIRIQGTPTEIISYQYLGYEHWKYGRSTVTISISSRRVTEWDNYDRNLKIRMFPDRNTTDSATFTLGSHQDDVIRIQGTPTEIISYQYLGYEHWKYGRSTVTISISSRQVTEWDNYDGNLKTH